MVGNDVTGGAAGGIRGGRSPHSDMWWPSFLQYAQGGRVGGAVCAPIGRVVCASVGGRTISASIALATKVRNFGMSFSILERNFHAVNCLIMSPMAGDTS